MNIIEIIEKKRDKKALSSYEIEYFINEYVRGNIPDYQISPLLMAICINGMNDKETYDLTNAMLHSGDIWHLNSIKGKKVDKHSTGGVGDKVSLIVGPILAACGLKVAKMSGRGLGHTGGTLDKMESIPGVSVTKTKEDFIKQIDEIGVAIIGQDSSIDPADKLLYRLRDVTGTVKSIPLIASSIMSKKLVSGADYILLDVKCGKGAFCNTFKMAKELSIAMINIGKRFRKSVKAHITSMDQPLGNNIGNTLEVLEAIETLKGNGPSDLNEVCFTSCVELLKMAYKINDKKAENMVQEVIHNGKAFEKFKEFIAHQGGNISYIDNPNKFKKAEIVIEIRAIKEGYIESLNALKIGLASMHLGAGRFTLKDKIDHSAGIILNKKIGDYCENNELLCTLYTNKEDVDEAISLVNEAYKIGDYRPKKVVLIKDVI